MKILLIEPAKAAMTIGGEDAFVYEPLALEYVAAGVADEYEVKILDLRLDKSLERTLQSYDPDIVGITAYTVHVNVVKGLFESVKAWKPHVLTVVGGHHATVRPQDLVSPAIDLIVLGEGVFPFRDIARRHETGKGFDGIPGTARARDGGLAIDAALPETALDAFPFPRRDLTAEYRNRYFSEWMRPLASLRTSKGCPFRCNFCALWKVAGGRYHKRQPEKIIQELATLDEDFVFFADDESLVDTKRMMTLASMLGNSGIRKRYFLYGRSDTIAGNPKLLEAWRKVGLERVFVGLESFKDTDLESIRKGSSTGDNKAAVDILHDLDIDIYASLIVRPDFTRDDFAACRQYCRDLRLDYATFASLTPLPGTDFYQEVEHQLLTDNYDLFDLIHTLLPTALPLKDFYEEYYKLVRGAISPREQLAMLRKMKLGDLPRLLGISLRISRQIRNAYRDYENIETTGV